MMPRKDAFKHLHGVTQESDWAVVFTFRDIILVFPNWYYGAGHPGLRCPVLCKDLIEQGSKDHGSTMPHQLLDINWDVIWPSSFAILHSLHSLRDFGKGD